LKKTRKKKDEKLDITLSDEDGRAIQDLKTFLRSIEKSKLKSLVPVDFEKDDDKNHHIDWITSATNMRSWNYYIKPSTRDLCRLTAGKIIPAISTTTACITGFVQLEILKYILGKDLNSHRSATIDLAVNMFVLENLPDPVKVMSDKDNKENPYVVYPQGFTCWDKVVVDRGDLTIQEFCNIFPTIHFGVTINTLFKHGITEAERTEGKGKVLYMSRNPFAGSYNMAKQMVSRQGLSDAVKLKFQKQIEDYEMWAKKNDIGNKKLSTHYMDLYGPLTTASRNYILLEGTFEDADRNQARIPTIKFIFKKAT